MKILYFDCTNGVSSDMVLKALTDIGNCEKKVKTAMDALDFTGKSAGHDHSHDEDTGHEHHEHEHSHGHGRSYVRVRSLIENSGFTAKSTECALCIYECIAKAEAKVHEETLETVHFHEVGRDEAIKNVLGIGMALEIIDADEIYVSDIYDGKGTIICSHGEIPVPVPAVMALREQCDFEFKQADVETEMVTPSGLAALMGMGAKKGTLTGKVIRETEAKGKRDTGRGGLKVYLTEVQKNGKEEKVKKTEEVKTQPDPVRNPQLKAAMKSAKENPGMETTVRFLNEVVTARLLAPVEMDKAPEYDMKLDEVILEKDTEIRFELIKAANGALYYPVFTDGEEMRKVDIEKDQHSLILNFDDLAAMLLQPQNAVAGFVINPMSDNVVFSTEMVAAMKKDMEKEQQ